MLEELILLIAMQFCANGLKGGWFECTAECDKHTAFEMYAMRNRKIREQLERKCANKYKCMNSLYVTRPLNT